MKGSKGFPLSGGRFRDYLGIITEAALRMDRASCGGDFAEGHRGDGLRLLKYAQTARSRLPKGVRMAEYGGSDPT